VSPEAVAVSRCVAGSPGLVRVTVTSSTRRVDLVLPGAVPVADLVPELARGVGLLDAKTVHGGYRLVTPDGRALAADSGLTVQGVEDGAVITVAAGVDDEPPRVYDDVVEAMTDVVERDLRPWDGAAGRRTTLGAATAVLALGAAALLSQRGSDVATAVTVVVAVGLVVAAVAASRSPSRGAAAAVTMALAGCGYAAVAGLMTGGGAPLSGTPIAAAGGGAVVTGFVAALGLGRSRALLLPAVVAGGVLVAAGLAVRSRSGDAAVVLTSVLALVVLAGSLFPWLALGVTGTGVDPPFPAGGPSGDPSGGAVRIDPQRVAADARVAHEILVGLSATVGVLLVLASAPAVSLGPAGTVVSLLACTTVTLRARQYHAHAEVLVGLVSGVLGLLATSASVLWLHPSWRPVAAVALEVTGAVLLTLALRPRAAAVRRGLGDLAEGAALLALLPALVIASGVVTTLRG
jgi:type VII secretion integral membrane protein EccD